MTDERFVFQQDVKERSKMKTGAFHKKNGCKSKKCTLPSDRLTASQKKKLNGECMSIKMNEPYHNWKDFKRLSIDMQRNYISNLVVEHQARSKDIAEMFNISPTTFSQYCIKFSPRIKFNGGRVMNEKWLDFITKPVLKKTEKIPAEEVADANAVADFEARYRDIPNIGTLPKEEVNEPLEHYGVKGMHCGIRQFQNADESLVELPVEEVGEAQIFSEEPANHTEKKVSGYNAMVKMSLDLKGSKEEIMQMMNAVLGDECRYIVSLKISNITNSQEVTDETI